MGAKPDPKIAPVVDMASRIQGIGSLRTLYMKVQSQIKMLKAEKIACIAICNALIPGIVIIDHNRVMGPNYGPSAPFPTHIRFMVHKTH